MNKIKSNKISLTKNNKNNSFLLIGLTTALSAQLTSDGLQDVFQISTVALAGMSFIEDVYKKRTDKVDKFTLFFAIGLIGYSFMNTHDENYLNGLSIVSLMLSSAFRDGRFFQNKNVKSQLEADLNANTVKNVDDVKTQKIKLS